MALRIDMDDLEDMILEGKFQSQIDVSAHVRLISGWDGGGRWTASHTWRTIKGSLMPDALAAYNRLPLGRPINRNDTLTWTAVEAMRTGKCKNNHDIKSIEDLAPNGKGKLSCAECRRARARRRHMGPARKRWTTAEDIAILSGDPVPGRSKNAIKTRKSRLNSGYRQLVKPDMKGMSPRG